MFHEANLREVSSRSEYSKRELSLMLYSLITLSHLLKFILCIYDLIKVKKILFTQSIAHEMMKIFNKEFYPRKRVLKSAEDVTGTFSDLDP